ncbi:MAG: glucan biosynthesis protein [Chthoniobacterales bacterium]
MARWLVFLLFLAVWPSTHANTPDDVFSKVVGQARKAAAAPFRPNEMSLPEVLHNLNYDTYRDITFRQEQGLWHGRSPFEIQFFHPGYLFKQPVVIHEVRADEVRIVPFEQKYFRYPDFFVARLGDKTLLSFAGFRVLYPLNNPGRLDEVISFVGSNYFRALGRDQAYGISARGVAIDTGEGLTEEFPDFREFWLCRPAKGARSMQIFAFLDGPTVAGAYRFKIEPGLETTVAVEAHLFFRKSEDVLGLAPLTSMFWRGEQEPATSHDPRPEVHDSDGLMIETASGEREWHPLRAVDHVSTESFPETNPKSFGLLQRDRDPSHYRDREAKYERRPSVRVESSSTWGSGKVRLMQLPAANEYNDNVVAFWQPAKAPPPGAELEFEYRLHWFKRESNKE